MAEAPHHGDVNALQFVATKGENLLFTASSNGSVLCYRVSDTSAANGMSDDADFGSPAANDSPLSSFVRDLFLSYLNGHIIVVHLCERLTVKCVGLIKQAIPQWENLFRSSPVTCLDVSESKVTIVAASESGGVAWLKLDHAMSVNKIGRRLPLSDFSKSWSLTI